MSNSSSSRRRKSPWQSLGGHIRDWLMNAFPLEIPTERLVVRLHNRSEISVYHSIFVQRVYPFDCIKAKIKTDDAPVVFDVGANSGLFAAAVFDHWPQAQVHSFEPQSRLIPRIKNVGARNGLEEQHTVNWCAVSGNQGEANFFENGNPISASLLQEKAARRSIRRVEQVKVITLDDYAKSHGINRVDILKLDVEGVEIDALRGAASVLNGVRLVFIEVHPPFSTYSQAAALLKAAGLECFSPKPEPNDQAQANAAFVRP